MKTPYLVQSVMVGMMVTLLSSCADRPIINVGTQFGASAHGLKDGYPSKASVGYDRSELAWLPQGRTSAVLGGFDAEFSPARGVAVTEVLATGGAASTEIAAKKALAAEKAAADREAAKRAAAGEEAKVQDDQSDKSNWKDKLLDTSIVSTTTRLNLGIEAASSDGPSPSFNFGYKRTVLAMFPALLQSPKIGGANRPSQSSMPDAYADISIHGSGLQGKIENPNGIKTESRQLTVDKGFRVVQHIAMGNAAIKAAENDAIGKKLIGDVKNSAAPPQENSPAPPQ